MDFQNSNPPSPHIYMTAPNSPTSYGRSATTMDFYYSAPASPHRRVTDAYLGSSFDEFEFEMSKRFSKSSSESPASRAYRERSDSLPAMAFADELFLNGRVMPLKPPPRLHTSPLSSPKSPRTVCRLPVCRLPFARKNSWNDDFDPFMVALDKVREEKRGRNSHHRRSRSYSPFRAISKDSSIGASPIEPMPEPIPSYSGPLDFKGSAYARWVRDQTEHGLSPKSPRGLFTFGQRVRPVKTEHDVLDKPAQPIVKHTEESKVQKLKGLLVRYASFGRSNSGSKQTKTSTEARKLSYFGRVSFKFKGSAHSNSKKKIPADANMAVVLYKPPSIASCLGYRAGSAVKVK